MTLNINDTTMTSDQTAHTARLASGSQQRWELSWLPGQVLGRNSTITAMILADHAGERDLNERHRLWPFIENWAAELGLTGLDAVNRVSRPGARGQQHDREGKRPDPEAGLVTAQPRKHRDWESRSADSPRRTSGPPPEDDIAAATGSSVGQNSHGGRLAHSVDEAARLTGLSRALLYDQMRPGNPAYVKVGRRRLITGQHLQQFLGIAS